MAKAQAKTRDDWGKKKSLYYEGDVDVAVDSSDEDPGLIEAREAAQIKQKTMDDLDEEDFVPFLLTKRKTSASVSKPISDESTPIVESTSSTPSSKLLEQDAAELPKVLTALKNHLTETRLRVAELITEAKSVRSDPLFDSKSTDGEELEQGISLLTTKYHLLLNYCMNCTFYILMKIRKKSVKNHPVIKQLITLRLYLERVADVESRVRHVITRILSAADKADLPQDDLRPNIEAMIEFSDDEDESDEEEDDEQSSEVYRPPRVSGMELMDDDKQAHLEEAHSNRLKKSRLFQDLASEFTDAPERIGVANAEMNDMEQMMEHEQLEEDRMVRVEGKKAKKGKKKGMMDELTSIGKYSDDLMDLLDQESDLIDGGENRKRQFSSIIGASKNRKKVLSGDADLPINHGVPVKQSRPSEGDPDRFGGFSDDEVLPDEEQSEISDIEDDMAPKRSADVPKMDQDASGKRKTTWNINKNKGLTAHHSKASGNARVKYRGKYDSAKKKNESGKRKTRGSKSNYSGESGSINSNVRRSRKF
ncbi:hypothetical protein GEMRC1_008930 [Eukaryota sp. GEM-RC1]